MFKRDPEDHKVLYICIGRWRFKFVEGKYVGYYNSKLGKVI